MKTIFMIIISSMFLSTISNNIEKDSVEKVMTYKIQETEKIKIESTIRNTRTPIIILKKD
jgi:hypothetical protein